MPDDNFDDGSIAAFWTTSTPVGTITESGGTLNISIGSGVNGNWWTGTDEYAPIIYQNIPTTDFTMTVKVSSYSAPTSSYVGIMLYKDRDNAVVFGFGYDGGNKLTVRKILSNTGSSLLSTATTITAPVWLQIS